MLQDLKHAWRSLARTPGFAAVAILTLGVGIGLNTVLFSIINVLLFKPLAVERGEELVWLSSASTKPDGPQGNLTYPDVADLGQLAAFAGTTAYGYFQANVAGAGDAIRLDGQAVMDDFFEVLGVRPVRGVTLGTATASPAGRHVVISFALWQRLFGGKDEAVGESIRINGRDFTITGIAPHGFRGVEVFERADVWVPLSVATDVVPDVGRPLDRTSWWLKGVGRLKAGVGPEQAAAAARTGASAIARAFPDSHGGFTVVVDPIRGVAPDNRTQVQPLSALLLGVTLTVLLIACANVANLLVVRGVARGRDTAIRLALGASRMRLLRLHLVESLILAACGGGCALLLSMWLTDVLVQIAGVPFDIELAPDRRVLLFTAALSLLTALVFGLAPGLAASGVRPSTQLKGDARTGGRSRLQTTLVAAQLALSMVLLLTATLFLKSLVSARSVDVGFEPRGRVALAFNLRMHGYSPQRADAFQRALLERVRARPGVRSAALASFVPLGGRVAIAGLTLPDRPQDPDVRQPTAALNHVSPDFFETMAIQIVRGRPLGNQDMSPVPTTAVVSQAFADREWPSRDPLGQRFGLEGPRGPFLEVVGVAANTIVDELNERPMAAAYLPGGTLTDDVSLLAWVEGNPAEALRALEADARALDGNVAVFDAKTLEAHIGDRMDSERGLSRILSVAGGMALGLAALGLYGVVAYTVVRRTREIGVRMALGARPADVVRLFLVDAARLAAIGVACGLPPAFAISALLASTLVGGQVGDPMAISGVTIVLALVTLLAAYVPARRALRVDPIVALRAE